MTKETNKPVQNFKWGRVRASVWQNTTNDGTTFHTVTFECNYKKDGKWHNGHSFGLKDLYSLIRVASDAARFCSFPETKEKEAA